MRIKIIDIFKFYLNISFRVIYFVDLTTFNYMVICQLRKMHLHDEDKSLVAYAWNLFSHIQLMMDLFFRLLHVSKRSKKIFYCAKANISMICFKALTIFFYVLYFVEKRKNITLKYAFKSKYVIILEWINYLYNVIMSQHQNIKWLYLVFIWYLNFWFKEKYFANKWQKVYVVW